MLENATRICEASFGTLLLYDGDVFRHVALHNAPQAWAAEQQRDPVPPRHAARVLYRVADTKQVAHIADIAAENPDRADRHDRRRADPSNRADAQGKRTDRRLWYLPPGGPPVHRQADRAGPELRRARPSSPSRTPACSTSCANHCSSRPPPPTCSRSSAGRPSICRRCSIHSSSRLHGCARLIWEPSGRPKGARLPVCRQLSLLPPGVRRACNHNGHSRRPGDARRAGPAGGQRGSYS